MDLQIQSAEKPKGRFKLEPGPGRPKGVPNKRTTLLKDAILLAAERVGSNGKGKGGLTGYCEFLARDHPPVFGALMRMVLPQQLAIGDASAGGTLVVTWLPPAGSDQQSPAIDQGLVIQGEPVSSAIEEATVIGDAPKPAETPLAQEAEAWLLADDDGR